MAKHCQQWLDKSSVGIFDLYYVVFTHHFDRPQLHKSVFVEFLLTIQTSRQKRGDCFEFFVWISRRRSKKLADDKMFRTDNLFWPF